MNTNPDEVKLCPWCNKIPEQSQDIDEVYCFNPHCCLHRFAMTLEDWNTRHTPAQPSGMKSVGEWFTEYENERHKFRNGEISERKLHWRDGSLVKAIQQNALASISHKQPSLDVEKIKNDSMAFCNSTFTKVLESSSPEKIQEIMEALQSALEKLERFVNKGFLASHDKTIAQIRQAIHSTLALRK